MAEITNLSDLEDASAITEAQIHAILNSISVQIYNLVAGNGTWGGVDSAESGSVGHRVYPSRTLNELRRLHAHFLNALNDPSLRSSSEMAVLISQFDNPYR